MKKMKKIMALLLTAVMVMGMSLTAFAAEGTKPTENDAKGVVVSNLENGAKVNAYQVIDAVYNENGFVRYDWAPNTGKTGEVNFNEKGAVKGLTSEFITGLAKDPSKLTKHTEADVVAAEGEATLTLPAGTWMIIVTPPTNDAAKVYNPMIASVYYAKSGSDNSMNSGSVDANSNWTLETTGAYAKSSEITLAKAVDDTEAEVANDTVTFTVTTTIPSYSQEYNNDNLKFEVKDEIVNGLAYTENLAPVVKVNGSELTDKQQYDYTMSEGENSFTISFKKDYLLGLANTENTGKRNVEITYTAKLTDAAINAPAMNTATLAYSDTAATTATKSDSEKVYTFAVNGVLKKVNEKHELLKGAEFTLYKKQEGKNLSEVFATCITTEDGNIKFEGLDADRTYYLKETKAPEGYSLNDKVYTITFGWDIANPTTYKVLVDGEEKAVITYGQAPSNFGDEVVNTKLSSLPSTGGIGTTIFTIAGCVIMIAAAGMFFANRKKDEK